jgi:MFS family permease
MATTHSDHAFLPEERPLFPGSPYTPAHPEARRIGYLCSAVAVGILATVGNALVTVNISPLAGGLGLYVAQANWLPAIFVAMNASANLLLIRARTQFGIPLVTRSAVGLYIAMALLQFIVPGFASAVAIRAAAGIAAAGLTTLTVYYMIQALPATKRGAAIALGITIPQLGTPLARLVPVELLAQDGWFGLHMLELAFALLALAASVLMPLPPSDRSKAFRKLDLVTIALLMPAFVLLCATLNLGRTLWWFDTPWLGWMLAGSVVLFAAAALVERGREQPLLHLDWISSRDILRFATVAVLVRIALAEQTYGAVGLLTSGGLNNDQLRVLFLFVLMAMVLGGLVAALTATPDRLRFLVMTAALCIAAGAWLDSDASNVTRPPQLYLSQALIGFGTCLFLGPGLLFGFLQMMQRGPAFLVSFFVLFSTTQNIGGLAGSALLGTMQTFWTRRHAEVLAEQLVVSDPRVAAQLQQSASLLNQAIQREANILAYNNVFGFVALLGVLTAAYLAFRIVVVARARRATAATAGMETAT